MDPALGEARGKDGVQKDRFSSSVHKNFYMGFKKALPWRKN